MVLNLHTEILSENERFDGRKFNDFRHLTVRKINKTYFFYNSDRSIDFFIQFKREEAEEPHFYTNGEFRHIKRSSLTDKKTGKTYKVAIILIDPLNKTYWREFDEHSHNGLIYVAKDNDVELRNCAEAETYTGNSKFILRDPLKEEELDWNCKIVGNRKITKKVEKIGPGSNFLSLFN